MGADAAAAVQAARAAPGQIATLVLPSDTSWDEGGVVADALPVAPPTAADSGTVEAVARVLRSGEPALLLLGGRALRQGPLALAAAIAAATGARMLAEQANARIERGRGRTPIGRMPYPADQALQALRGLKHIVLVGSAPPVSFFAYPGLPGRMYPDDCTIHRLTRPDQDGPGALAALAEALGAKPAPPTPVAAPELARGKVTPEGMAAGGGCADAGGSHRGR